MALAGGSTAALDAMFLDGEPDVASVDAAGEALAEAAAKATPVAAPPAVRSLSERLADAFRGETPRLLVELDDAITQRDFARAARIAHNIKGSAFYIHSEQMAEDAGGLEEACDTADDAGVERHWAALQESIDDWMTAH
jgi:HPt (histidine-containing phosphotransfer) domain-containing protein